MGKVRDLAVALNGKKLPMVLIMTIVGGGIGYGELKTTVKHNRAQVEKLDKVPAQIAAIETDVRNIKDDMRDFKTDQREIRTDIKAIYKAVVK